MEPLEGSKEANRLAAVSRVLLRALRCARTPAGASCAGVVNIVAFDGEPAPIPTHEIASIRQLVESDFAFDPCPLVREGMLVEVTHGPLKGVVGRLIRKSDKARLMLTVDLIGQAVSVEVDASDVRPF